jgi:hypothetical protein
MKNGERRARATLTVDEARDGVGRPDSGGIQTWRRRSFGKWQRRGWDGVRRGEARRFGQRRRRDRNGATLSRCRRAVPTAHLMHGRGMVRGSHAAMARCQEGPAQIAASDRWNPFVSVFRIKITPDKNRSK